MNNWVNNHKKLRNVRHNFLIFRKLGMMQTISFYNHDNKTWKGSTLLLEENTKSKTFKLLLFLSIFFYISFSQVYWYSMMFFLNFLRYWLNHIELSLFWWGKFCKIIWFYKNCAPVSFGESKLSKKEYFGAHGNLFQRQR